MHFICTCLIFDRLLVGDRICCFILLFLFVRLQEKDGDFSEGCRGRGKIQEGDGKVCLLSVRFKQKSDRLIQDIVTCEWMCFRIESEERKHNRNWEEDWGSREKSKSPSPAPSPSPPSRSPPPPKPRSSGMTIALMHCSMLTPVLLCMNAECEFLLKPSCSLLMIICLKHMSRHLLTYLPKLFFLICRMTACAFSFYECNLFLFSFLVSLCLCLLWLALLTCTAAEANIDEDEENESREVSGDELFFKGNRSLHVKIFH